MNLHARHEPIDTVWHAHSILNSTLLSNPYDGPKIPGCTLIPVLNTHDEQVDASFYAKQGQKPNFTRTRPWPRF